MFQQLTALDCEFTSHYVSIQFTTLSLSLARSMRSFTMSIVRADARCCDSGTNCA
jgi:surfactin synthase thioesterase subunit